MSRSLLRAASLVPLVACATAPPAALAPPVPLRADARAWSAIDGAKLRANIATLSSDDFEGRAPGSPAEQKTLELLISRFRALGLEPGNPDGTFLQSVPLVGITADPAAALTISSLSGDAPPHVLRFGDEFVAWTKHEEPSVSLDHAPLVFVGYGVTAPEYHWDDFKDADVRGKVLVILVNDPPVPDPRDPSQLDPTMFKGRAMTYYGRWTYKFEEAAARGAAGALIVHETGPAGYPWEVVRNSNTREQFSLVSPDGGRSRCAVEGWITEETARALFQLAGQDFEALHRAAIRPDFRPIALGLAASITVRNTIRHVESHNVIAKLEGSDPVWRNQSVIYTAHWDHLGRNGNAIYHGAVDNASGASGLIELARAFTSAATRPRRTILFLSVTAEEKGLLGSEYYATHPLYPLRDTAAEINMDGLNVHGRTRDVTIIGLGQSTLDEVTAEVAAVQGRTVHAEPQPEKGFYYRSDHLSFARQGVPALDAGGGVEYIGRPQGWGIHILDDFTAHDYHKPTDVVKADWDMTGAVEDLQLLYSVGRRVADADALPEWSKDSEFRAIREKTMRCVP